MSVNPRGTDKEYNHLYLSRVYGPLFSQMDKIKNILEIGIGGGYSIKLWLEYLSPSQIVAIDTDVNFFANLRAQNLPNVRLINDDAYSRRIAKLFASDFDLIIDDGPHSYWSLKAAIRIYLAKLRPGGILVVEDIPAIEDVLNKLILSSKESLVCCQWLVDSRMDARLSDDSVALVIHRLDSDCSLRFEKGVKVSRSSIQRSFVLRMILFLERLNEFFKRKVYFGMKYRFQKIMSQD